MQLLSSIKCTGLSNVSTPLWYIYHDWGWGNKKGQLSWRAIMEENTHKMFKNFEKYLKSLILFHLSNFLDLWEKGSMIYPMDGTVSPHYETLQQRI